MNFQDAEAVADFHQAFLKRFHLLLIGAVCNFKRSAKICQGFFIELVRGAWRGLVGPRLQQQFGQNVGRNDGTPRPARIMLPSSSPISIATVVASEMASEPGIRVPCKLA